MNAIGNGSSFLCKNYLIQSCLMPKLIMVDKKSLCLISCRSVVYARLGTDSINEYLHKDSLYWSVPLIPNLLTNRLDACLLNHAIANDYVSNLLFNVGFKFLWFEFIKNGLNSKPRVIDQTIYARASNLYAENRQFQKKWSS